MIALKDIYKAVSKFITAKTKAKMIDCDFEEPIIRPSFRLFMDTVKSGHFSSAMQDLTVFFNLYFYADDKFAIMDFQDKISDGFLEPLEINDATVVYINDLEFERLPNKILSVGFNFEIGLEFVDERGLEDMEKLRQR